MVLMERGNIIMREFKELKIAVVGTGYVGLSIATLLAQHHQGVSEKSAHMCKMEKMTAEAARKRKA